MKPYILSKLPEEEIELFKKIRKAVEELPDVDLGKKESGENLILSCHILARAVGNVFRLKHIDGYFYPCYEHTWLATKHGNIIDVYPVAVLGGPVLMDGALLSPSRWLYKNKRILNGKTKKPSFRRAVRIITKALEKLAV